MKFSLAFLVTIFALVVSVPVKKDGVVKSNDFLIKQKHVLELLYHINQPHPSKSLWEIANTYSIEEHKADYIKPEVVYTFLEYHHYDAFIPRGVIFSVMNTEHLNQAIALFKLMYYAKDWETFYKTSVWARQHMNEGMFIYAFSVAVVHREDTQEIVLPPIYEISPHYFFSQEVIQQANILKQVFDKKLLNLPQADPHFNGYTIDSNYSGWYLNLHSDQSLSYYLEDIDLNAQYYYFYITIPFWMNAEEFNLETPNRGLLYLSHARHILARYNLERLSNGFSEVNEIDFDSPVDVPYTPSLSYPNGLPFPSRPKFANLLLHNANDGTKLALSGYSYSLNYVKDYCRRIDDITDEGYALAQNFTYVKLDEDAGLNVLGNIMQYNNDSVNSRYYGPIEAYSRYLLGYSYQPLNNNKLVPSVLEHFETSLRDPVIYQWLKKIVNWSRRYMLNVPPYTKNQLIMPGVEITGVKFDPLITYFDHVYSDLTNAIWYNEHEKPGDFKIRVRQERLNHKPFSYRLSVKSDKDQQVVIRAYLGPKYDEYGRKINLTENSINFVHLEHFVYDIKAGENIIVRNSHDFTIYMPDRLSYWRIWDMVNGALNGTEEFVVPKQSHIYFSNRIMLPLGSENGKPYQFFFIIFPYHGVPNQSKYVKLFDKIPLDDKLFGYPWNRNVEFEKMWEALPNVLFHEEKIYYKDIYAIKHSQPV